MVHASLSQAINVKDKLATDRQTLLGQGLICQWRSFRQKVGGGGTEHRHTSDGYRFHGSGMRENGSRMLYCSQSTVNKPAGGLALHKPVHFVPAASTRLTVQHSRR